MLFSAEMRIKWEREREREPTLKRPNERCAAIKIGAVEKMWMYGFYVDVFSLYSSFSLVHLLPFFVNLKKIVSKLIKNDDEANNYVYLFCYYHQQTPREQKNTHTHTPIRNKNNHKLLMEKLKNFNFMLLLKMT